MNKIGDYDAWLHLSNGRLIWELKGIPDMEPFTYPAYDSSYYYSSWLFGVLCYLTYSIFDVFGLVILKGTVITLAFFIMVKDSLRPYRNAAISVIIMTTAFLLSHYRFVLRPDIFFMVFITFSIFSLNAYLYDNKKYIYALPLTHLLWANMHSSITVMFVPFMAFIAGGIIQAYLGKRGMGFDRTPSPGQLKIITLIFIASIAATFVNPYAAGQYFYGSQFLSSDWYVKHIVELRPIEAGKRLMLFALSAIVLVSFFVNRRKLSIIHLLMFIPFVYLGLSARRFPFVIAIVGFPIMARNISASLESKGIKPSMAMIVISAALVVISSMALIFEAVAEKRYGFGFDYSLVPKGAVEYMDRREIYGRVLNHFQFGQYITWESYPRRPVFVDGRGHLSEELLEKMVAFTKSSRVLDDLYDRYGFDYILATYWRNERAVFAPSADPEWALVYWDDVSLVYLRRETKYKDMIAEDEYGVVSPEVSPLRLLEIADGQIDRSGLIKELERNIYETGSVRALVSLGYIRLAENSLDEAGDYLMDAVKKSPRDASAHYGLGVMYNKLGNKKAAGKHFQLARSYALYEELENAAEGGLKGILLD